MCSNGIIIVSISPKDPTQMGVCTENLDTDVVVMKSAKDRL